MTTFSGNGKVDAHDWRGSSEWVWSELKPAGARHRTNLFRLFMECFLSGDFGFVWWLRKQADSARARRNDVCWRAVLWLDWCVSEWFSSECPNCIANTDLVLEQLVTHAHKTTFTPMVILTLKNTSPYTHTQAPSSPPQHAYAHLFPLHTRTIKWKCYRYEHTIFDFSTECLYGAINTNLNRRLIENKVVINWNMNCLITRSLCRYGTKAWELH